ncbi:beta-galactosidase [alpha proteobacterium AAP81b]|nr:beta-galactosidase [alpha proteobacterium AAP81b]
MLGVCYYPEHWPEHRWAEDAARMRGLGLSRVRIGEFAWARLEPRAGEFDFGWFDRAIATLGEAGLGIVIGTPTATPPKWLVDAHPEILPVDPVTGLVRRFGSRRHYDFSSEIYLEQALRITRALVERYGDHPAVVGWQIDNEVTCHDTTLSGSPAAAAGFRDWCRTRYGSIAALNQAWGNVFWSMDYGDWGEIDLPIQTVCEPNPAHRLAWRRHASDMVARFVHAQAAAIREGAATRQFVTTNFIPYLDTGVDNFALTAPLDFASFDSYPLGIADMALAKAPAATLKPFVHTGWPDLTSLNLDMTRGLSRDAFWIMEQQPGPVNWAPHNPRPAPGMVRLWTLQAFAHGAACVSYFRWRQAPFAQEQMHAGLLRPDSMPAPAWAEVEQVVGELAVLGDLSLRREPAAVALIVDAEAGYVSDIQPQGRGWRYNAVVLAWYGALRRLGLDVDCVPPGASLAGYALVVAPSLAMPDNKAVAALTATDARIVLGPRSGGKTPEFTLPDGLPPGPLAALVPARVTLVETLRRDCPGGLHWQGRSFTSHSWRESLEALPGGEVIARSETGDAVAVSRGRVSYIGTLTCDDFLTDFLAAEAQAAGLATLRLPDTLRIATRGDLGFAFNHAATPVACPAPAGADYLIGAPDVPAYGVSVWRRA